MRGDLLLYRGTGRWYERLIQLGTRGPYVHVEVDIGAGESVGALTGGVVRHRIPMGAVVAPTAYRTDPARLTGAVDWLVKQAGDQYGWFDIADDVVHAAIPWAPWVSLGKTFDCSDLATKFLWMAGYPLPPAFLDGATVSPNDLARAVGLIR